MKIGEVAKRTGLSIDTLRFYEKIGLIDQPLRDGAGRRDYGADMLEWIAFLGRLNATGMKQADRVRYADLRRKGDATLAMRRDMIEAHRRQVVQQIAMLTDSLDFLDAKIETYRDMERDYDRHTSATGPDHRRTA
ncbi:MerR family transcriptional regulator [Paracoccus aerodenitrificans]|uniref:MerR family transcriptional regulator n=1 Tax=Paracoccus aerodenitrificans TaxID=3017781 RepID=UPI0022F0539F|nr:MerR family transcriptional regulator [Paracoccus aerodenitrificans]WBU65500.1 MerR family transcriptional regulator [Paracoccus aerodenitrificans]